VERAEQRADHDEAAVRPSLGRRVERGEVERVVEHPGVEVGGAQGRCRPQVDVGRDPVGGALRCIEHVERVGPGRHLDEGVEHPAPGGTELGERERVEVEGGAPSSHGLALGGREQDQHGSPSSPRACWRIQVCMAMPDATPALIERVEPNMAIEHTRLDPVSGRRRQPGALLAEQQHAAPGQRGGLERHAAGQVVDSGRRSAGLRCSRAQLVATERVVTSGWWCTCW
jgi:hypothetical protein